MGLIRGMIGNGERYANGTYTSLRQLYSCFTVIGAGSLYTDVFYNDKAELQIRLSVYPDPAPRKGFVIYEGPFPRLKEDTLPHFAKMVQDALETEG